MLNIIFKQINFFLHTAAFTNLATSRVIYGDFGKIRTFDLRIRSALLYPAELRSRNLVSIIVVMWGTTEK